MTEATIEMVRFDTAPWLLNSSNAFRRVWINDFGEAVSLNLFQAKPNIPVAIKSAKIKELRNAYRGFAKAAGAGIVSVEIVQILGIPSVEVILKKPLESQTGFIFLGSLTLPLRDFSYVIRFEALERGVTGYRETAVMIIEQPVPQIDETTRKIIGWIHDPYDPAFNETAFFNPADQEKYDKMFEHHPLSRVRGHLHELRQTIEVDSFVTESPRHSPGWLKSIFKI